MSKHGKLKKTSFCNVHTATGSKHEDCLSTQVQVILRILQYYFKLLVVSYKKYG